MKAQPPKYTVRSVQSNSTRESSRVEGAENGKPRTLLSENGSLGTYEVSIGDVQKWVLLRKEKKTSSLSHFVIVSQLLPRTVL